MKSAIKQINNQTRRDTVETVPSVGGTSLKRGVNERGTRHPSFATRLAFTLIELLVVIAIMAILAALIIPITGAVTRNKLRNRTKGELRSIETAIVDYKTKKGYYPPDNPNNNYNLNQLYYELAGTVYSNGVYVTLDGNAVLDPTQINTPVYGKGFQAIVNTTKGGGDEGMAAQKFLKDTHLALGETSLGVKFLVGSVGWDRDSTTAQQVPVGPAKVLKLNPFHYVSTNPTNNPSSFDLWIDIIVQGKTNRICNWSEDPIVL
jgi:prepilin-type N-terminal cleavage/methylation domain-containing protein